MEHIGIDVHKTSSQVCTLTDDGELIERRIKTARESFAQLLGARLPARILIEASTESEWVAQCLDLSRFRKKRMSSRPLTLFRCCSPRAALPPWACPNLSPTPSRQKPRWTSPRKRESVREKPVFVPARLLFWFRAARTTKLKLAERQTKRKV